MTPRVVGDHSISFCEDRGEVIPHLGAGAIAVRQDDWNAGSVLLMLEIESFHCRGRHGLFSDPTCGSTAEQSVIERIVAERCRRTIFVDNNQLCQLDAFDSAFRANIAFNAKRHVWLD